jgi:hypothetical protein
MKTDCLLFQSTLWRGNAYLSIKRLHPICFRSLPVGTSSWNANRGATWLDYDSYLQGIQAKQITTENMYESKIQQWCSGAEIKSPPGNSPHCFRIHGQIYHLILPLRPNQRNTAGYGLYMYFRFFWSSNKTAWRPIKPRAYGRRNVTIGRDAATS